VSFFVMLFIMLPQQSPVPEEVEACESGWRTDRNVSPLSAYLVSFFSPPLPKSQSRKSRARSTQHNDSVKEGKARPIACSRSPSHFNGAPPSRLVVLIIIIISSQSWQAKRSACQPTKSAKSSSESTNPPRTFTPKKK